MMVEPDEPAPFPDIPAEAPGMLTELEEAYGFDEVVQVEPKHKKHVLILRFGKSRSGMIAHKNKTRITAGTQYDSQ
jgi:hypothetical protein